MPQLAEQARILDGNDGLRRKVFEQRDLLLGERADLLPVNKDGANQGVILQHRDTDT